MQATTMLVQTPAKQQLAAQRTCLQRTVMARKAPARMSRRHAVITRAADTAAVTEDVRKIIAQQLGTELNEVKPDSNFTELGADSLDTVEIMMALEEKFDIQLDEEEAQKLSTVQQAADAIAKLAK